MPFPFKVIHILIPEHVKIPLMLMRKRKRRRRTENKEKEKEGEKRRRRKGKVKGNTEERAGRGAFADVLRKDEIEKVFWTIQAYPVPSQGSL
jgi:hypothetical protein